MANSFGHFDQLDDIQSPLAILVLRHERLRPLQPFGQLNLGKASMHALFDKQLLKPFLTGRAAGAWHEAAHNLFRPPFRDWLDYIPK